MNFIDRHIGVAVAVGIGGPVLVVCLLLDRTWFSIGYFVFMTLYYAHKSDQYFEKYLDARYPWVER